MATRTIALITGANSGIGYEAVKALLQSPKPYHIFLGSRSVDKGNHAVEILKKEYPQSESTLEAIQVDLTSDDSIQKAFDQVEKGIGYLDTLVNNAGSTFDIEHIRGNVNLRESFTRSYDVNVAGTNVMTHVFMPLLHKSSSPRLIFVTGLSNLTKAAEENYFPTPPPATGWPKKTEFEVIGYRCTKVALNMLMLDWNHKVKQDGVKVFAVAPGFLATNLGGMPEAAKAMGAGHPSAGGDILRRVVEGERDADVGKIVQKDGGLVAF